MRNRSWIKFAVMAAMVVGAMGQERPTVRVAIAQDLPAMPGDHLRTTLLEVTLPPGGFSTLHTHPCPVIGFILSGTIRFQINNDPELVLHAGESFYEPANSAHKVGANLSKTKKATFLAYFVCNGEQELSKPMDRAK